MTMDLIKELFFLEGTSQIKTCEKAQKVVIKVLGMIASS